jgi:hypothetical protein
MLKAMHPVLVAIAVVIAPALAAPSSPLALRAVLQLKPGLWDFAEKSKVTGDTVVSDAMLANIPAAGRAQYLVETRKMLAEPSEVRDVMNTRPGKTMTTDATESGHWLGSNCAAKAIEQVQ